MATGGAPLSLRRFLLTATPVALAGSVVGLVWAHLAPTLSVAAVAAGSDSAFRAQIGADVTFGSLGAVAGVLSAAGALAGRAFGPEVVAGLAVGGGAGAVVADRVGYLVNHPATVQALHRLGLTPTEVNVGLLDFRVRALGVLVVWPLVAVAVYAAAHALRGRR